MTQVSQQSEPTPEPTRDPPVAPPGDYPNLDETLQAIVLSYEGGSKSESEAAADAPLNHITKVLVQVDLTSNVDAVDTWMDKRDVSPRFVNREYNPPYIYAYAPVSRLGELSQQSGVSIVRTMRQPFGDDVIAPWPGETDEQARTRLRSEPDPNSSPVLPFWLKGYEAPGTYYNARGLVRDFWFMHQRGELTAEFMESSGYFEDGKLSLYGRIEDDSQLIDSLITWLNDNSIVTNEDGTPATRGDFTDSSHQNSMKFGAYVPPSLIGPLSERPGILRLEPLGMDYQYGDEESQFDGLPQRDSGKTDTSSVLRESLAAGLGTVVSEGVEKHGADEWQDITPPHLGGVRLCLLLTTAPLFL